MKASPLNITSVGPAQVFVFGSNQAGRHGAGAAKQALTWGAKYGQAEGLQGRTYAIPTKDKYIYRSLSVDEIRPYVDRFIQFAKENPHLEFLVTEVGCGRAGHQPKCIAPLFVGAADLRNVLLPVRFIRKIKMGKRV